jgi:membrane protease YdiL (CAAX protease family)
MCYFLMFSQRSFLPKIQVSNATVFYRWSHFSIVFYPGSHFLWNFCDCDVSNYVLPNIFLHTIIHNFSYKGTYSDFYRIPAF